MATEFVPSRLDELRIWRNCLDTGRSWPGAPPLIRTCLISANPPGTKESYKKRCKLIHPRPNYVRRPITRELVRSRSTPAGLGSKDCSIGSPEEHKLSKEILNPSHFKKRSCSSQALDENWLANLPSRSQVIFPYKSSRPPRRYENSAELEGVEGATELREMLRSGKTYTATTFEDGSMGCLARGFPALRSPADEVLLEAVRRKLEPDASYSTIPPSKLDPCEFIATAPDNEDRGLEAEVYKDHSIDQTAG